METTRFATGTQVRVTATDLTLAPAGTVTEVLGSEGRMIVIRVGDSAINVETTDIEAI